MPHQGLSSFFMLSLLRCQRLKEIRAQLAEAGQAILSMSIFPQSSLENHLGGVSPESSHSLPFVCARE